MLRLPAFILASLTAAWLAAAVPAPALADDMATQFVGPTRILFVDADSVYFLRSLEWHAANVRQQEKLLLHSLRMTYWRDHLPADMRAVYDALGYPVGRVLYSPVGHTEEWWTYRLLDPPLRFRDGVLMDTDRFEALRSR